jgi:hypothetical protein
MVYMYMYMGDEMRLDRADGTLCGGGRWGLMRYDVRSSTRSFRKFSSLTPLLLIRYPLLLVRYPLLLIR